MAQVTPRPPEKVEREHLRMVPELRRTPPFMRWLGWLIVAALLLGGAGLIWYGIANEAETVPAASAPAVSEIDPYENPELKARINLAPASLATLSPHENPEIASILSAFDAAEARIP